MRAAFVHDNIFMYDSNANYFNKGGFEYPIFQRYLKHFSCVRVVSRARPVEALAAERYSLSSGEGVSFSPVTDFGIKALLSGFKGIRASMCEAFEQVDFVIARLPSVIGLIGCHEALKMGKPLAVEMVGCAWDAFWNHGSVEGKLMAPVMHYLTRYYMKRVEYAIYVSGEFLQNTYPFGGSVAIGCSDVNTCSEKTNILEERVVRISQINGSRPIKIGLIGTLGVEYKGHKTAIKALELLNRKHKYNFRLSCLGQGDPAKWIKLADKLGVSEFIEFCGTLPGGEKVFQWIDGIDILIMPSLAEGLPRALIEAMSRGCPCIASRVGGIPELLDPEFLFAPKKHRELAALILSLLENKRIMVEASFTNFIKAKSYSRAVTDQRRSEFWGKVLSNCNAGLKNMSRAV